MKPLYNRLQLARCGKNVAQKMYPLQEPKIFFEKEMLAYVEQTWEQWLAPLVSNLPPHEQVISELKPQIEVLINFE